MLPCDVLESVFFYLDYRSLSTARTVCAAWAEIGRQDAVVTAAVANTRSRLTHPVMKRGLGLTEAEVRSLPSTTYITRRGNTCRLYGPEAMIQGLKMNGGRRRLLKRRRKNKASQKRCLFFSIDSVC